MARNYGYSSEYDADCPEDYFDDRLNYGYGRGSHSNRYRDDYDRSYSDRSDFRNRYGSGRETESYKHSNHRHNHGARNESHSNRYYDDYGRSYSDLRNRYGDGREMDSYRGNSSRRGDHSDHRNFDNHVSGSRYDSFEDSRRHAPNHQRYHTSDRYDDRSRYASPHSNRAYKTEEMTSRSRSEQSSSRQPSYAGSYHRNPGEYDHQKKLYTEGYVSTGGGSFDDLPPDYGDDNALKMARFTPSHSSTRRERKPKSQKSYSDIPNEPQANTSPPAAAVAVLNITNEQPSAVPLNSDQRREVKGKEKEKHAAAKPVNGERYSVSSAAKSNENASVASEDETNYEDSDLDPIDPDLLSLKTVDLAKTIRLRRKLTRGRDPVLRKPDMDVPEVTEAGQLHVAQQFIKLYRQHVKETREQLLSQQTKDLTGIEKYKYQSNKRLQKTKSRVGEFFSGVEIWRGAFKNIEGNFGSSIVAYFRFVKWLFLMNLFTFIMILTVIVLPQELMEPSTFNDTLDGIEEVDLPKDYLDRHFDALVCSDNYTETLDQELDDQNIGLDILDFFLGTGWMERTVLFAGYYFNKTYFYDLDDDTGDIGILIYNMPVAYLITTAVYFVIILILMVNYTGKGVKDRLVNSGDKFNHCCNMVFCGWDYNLMAEKASKLKHKNLFNEFTNDMAEARREKERKNLSLAKRVCLFIIRLVIWTFVFVVWGSSFYVIVMVVGTWVPDLLEENDVAESWILTLIVEILPSLTITAINVVAAPLFQIIVRFEDYTPETEVRITIARTVILRLASIGVLSFTLHSRITECDDSICGNCDPIQCWETYVGQEYYKLVVVDFFVIVAVTFLVEFPRKLVVKRFPNNFVFSKVGLQEFELPKNVLEIVYSQTISWIGGFFSPLIPAITVIKLFVFFYVKKLTLMQNCIPAARPYRASKSNYFFMIILMVSYGLCLVIISYAIGRIPPSQSCGPWRVYSQEEYYMYTAVTDSIKLLPDWIEGILNILTNWVLYIILLIVLCLIIYYYQAISSGNKRKVELLKEQLALEGMDKQFLLRQVNLVLQRTAAQTVE